MKAVITVIGKDRVGIISMVSAECAASNVNVIDINQTVLDGYFTMIMVVEIGEMNETFSAFADRLANKGRENALEIRVMHEDIFNAMHKI
jgi:ACT domain-containing protein